MFCLPPHKVSVRTKFYQRKKSLPTECSPTLFRSVEWTLGKKRRIKELRISHTPWASPISWNRKKSSKSPIFLLIYSLAISLNTSATHRSASNSKHFKYSPFNTNAILAQTNLNTTVLLKLPPY